MIDSINNYFQISTCKKKSIVQKKGLCFCFKLLDTSFTYSWSHKNNSVQEKSYFLIHSDLNEGLRCSWNSVIKLDVADEIDLYSAGESRTVPLAVYLCRSQEPR